MSVASSGDEFSIQRLGAARVPSPLSLHLQSDSQGASGEAIRFVSDSQCVAHGIELDRQTASTCADTLGLMEKAGPREHLYFDPSKVHAGVVTCGGLCPGLNNVIRAIVMTLSQRYGVSRISGIRHGYQGLMPEAGLPIVDLTPERVLDIHRQGGSILGTSRGGGDRTETLVDAMERLNLNVLFTIGGDGTQRGALLLAREIARRGSRMAIVGVPKTIDNDLSFVERSFGFETAVSRAVDAVGSAVTEARGAINGIGIVKVMGRESGFIAAHTALATNDVNFVLIPEVPFELEGEHGLLAALGRCLRQRKHAIVLVAEGAGQELVAASGSDASGNRRLGDIGVYLKSRIEQHFGVGPQEAVVKYIDPSYLIRAAPANPADAIYCARLGSNAVHAAMAGRTSCLVGSVNNRLVHIPIELATRYRNRVVPNSPLWRDVLEATGQPPLKTPASAALSAASSSSPASTVLTRSHAPEAHLLACAGS